jgi:hypothetical protein
MQEVLEKILAILEAQDAKIKSLEAQLEAYGGGLDTLIENAHSGLDGDRFRAFSGKHRAKFEPYLPMMDKMEGGDSFRSIYDSMENMSGEEGYDEDAYVDTMLKSVIETIESLKTVVPAEAIPALEQAEAAIEEAAVTNDTAEGLPAETIEEAAGEGEIKDPAPEEWSVEELEKLKPEGRTIR